MKKATSKQQEWNFVNCSEPSTFRIMYAKELIREQQVGNGTASHMIWPKSKQQQQQLNENNTTNIVPYCKVKNAKQ